ncbi:uncharacterized protein LOC108093044 [Drosophila ficusphila]|uniref:uncharacterized protein LOC108093044 n=1 Tax=Drosophila ficusphila TaxID=30025 RepID=UPI001C890754|nr:uncharacterized protein LOC108093044 [Drosophila ficusphila]
MFRQRTIALLKSSSGRFSPRLMADSGKKGEADNECKDDDEKKRSRRRIFAEDLFFPPARAAKISPAEKVEKMERMTNPKTNVNNKRDSLTKNKVSGEGKLYRL